MLDRYDGPTGKFQHDPRRSGPPAEAAERFEWRVVEMMNTSGRSRTWCRQRVLESYPNEFAAFRASRG